MALKGKGKAEGKSFRWDLVATMTLLNICLDYQKANGVDQPFNWFEICEELGQRIGKKCCHVSVKNKFDYMKKLCGLWKTLRHNETGIELVEGRIVADDAWWDKKIKEKHEYKQFRKGVPPKIDDLWEQIFSAIVATGKHGGVAPTRSESKKSKGGKAQKKGMSFRWNLMRTKAFLTICLDYQKANGVDQPFSWVKISEELGQKIGQKCSSAIVKSKCDHIIKKLQQQNETKENENYQRFRKKGLPLGIEGLCKQIFHTIVATRKRGVASRDPLEADGGESEAQSKLYWAETQAAKRKQVIQELFSDSEVDSGESEQDSERLEVETDGGESESQFQSKAKADEGETVAQKSRMLQHANHPVVCSGETEEHLCASGSYAAGNCIVDPDPEPEVDGGATEAPTQSSMVQSQSEVDGGETEAQQHRMPQQDIHTTRPRGGPRKKNLGWARADPSTLLGPPLTRPVLCNPDPSIDEAHINMVPTLPEDNHYIETMSEESLRILMLTDEWVNEGVDLNYHPGMDLNFPIPGCPL